METVFETDPLKEYFTTVRSPLTYRNYSRDLKWFFDFAKLPGDFNAQARDFVKRGKQDPEWATHEINEYIAFQKKRVERQEIEESRLSSLYKPIKGFCEDAGLPLNYKRIAKRVPQGRSVAKDRLPEADEIHKVLMYPDRRIKTVILVLASSGCRIGAFDDFTWGDVEPIYEDKELLAAKIIIYRGSNEEYYSFITPEAYRAAAEYIEYRKAEGEKITKESPLLRDLIRGDRWGKAEPHIPTRLKAAGVKRILEDALKVMGVRTKLPEGKRRHPWKSAHGFRKFFKSQAEKSMKSLHVEMLLGHRTGLNENYYRPKQSELLEDYRRAVPDLTLLESPKVDPRAGERLDNLSQQNEDMRKELDELKANQAELITAVRIFETIVPGTLERAAGRTLKRSAVTHSLRSQFGDMVIDQPLRLNGEGAKTQEPSKKRGSHRKD